MKKLLLSTTLLLFTLFGYSQSDISLPIGRQLSMSYGDNLNYQDRSFGHYAIGWTSDPSVKIGPALWMSGYGGVKLFTNGKPRLSVNHDGDVGIGTDNPKAKLDVAGNALFQGNVLIPSGQISWNEGDNLTYQGRSFGHYAIGWTNDALASTGPALWMSGFAGVRLFTGGAPRFFIDEDGNVGIGTENPQAKLDVAGTIKGQAINGSSLNVTGAINSHSVRTNRLEVEGIIHAREIKVDLDKFPDYVFDEDYKLPTLNEVKAHIDEHKHLPGIPSEKEVLQNGINMGEMQVKLLEKVEELTLYVIQQQEEINTLKAKLENK